MIGGALMIGEKILVVDDEVHIVELIKYNLENNGYRVLTAYNGRDALKAADENEIDLIILDLMLPEIDGLDVCKTLKRKDNTSDIPIIMLTAKGEEFDKILGLELGADDYITKPFSVRELIARVKVILRRSSMESKDDDIIKLFLYTFYLG
jgi:two-component system alkaline phosphatase synthesis response regulator PhoP